MRYDEQTPGSQKILNKHFAAAVADNYDNDDDNYNNDDAGDSPIQIDGYMLAGNITENQMTYMITSPQIF